MSLKRAGTALALPAIVLVALIILISLIAARPARHSVELSWHPSPPVQGVTVVGYNVYRSTTPGGPYVRIASGLTGLTYHDWVVNNARTYYYVVTSVDARGHESTHSTEVRAKIP